MRPRQKLLGFGMKVFNVFICIYKYFERMPLLWYCSSHLAIYYIYRLFIFDCVPPPPCRFHTHRLRVILLCQLLTVLYSMSTSSDHAKRKTSLVDTCGAYRSLYVWLYVYFVFSYICLPASILVLYIISTIFCILFMCHAVLRLLFISANILAIWCSIHHYDQSTHGLLPPSLLV